MPAIPDRDILPLTNRIKNRIRKERKHIAKQKERFVEVYSQGLTNVEKFIVVTHIGVIYLLAGSSL